MRSTSNSQTLNSTCQAEGFPAPVVSWAMVPDDGRNPVSVSTTGFLQFVSFTLSQFGMQKYVPLVKQNVKSLS